MRILLQRRERHAGNQRFIWTLVQWAKSKGLHDTARLLATLTRLHIVAIAVMGTFTFGWLFTGRYLFLAAAVTGLTAP